MGWGYMSLTGASSVACASNAAGAACEMHCQTYPEQVLLEYFPDCARSTMNVSAHES